MWLFALGANRLETLSVSSAETARTIGSEIFGAAFHFE